MLDPVLRNMQSTHRYIHIAYSYILLVTQDMSKQHWDWDLGWVHHRIGKDEVGAGLLEEEMPDLPNWNIWVGRWWMRPMLRTEDIGLWPLARWQGWPHWSPGHRDHDATWIELSTGFRKISHCPEKAPTRDFYLIRPVDGLVSKDPSSLSITMSNILTVFECLFSLA